MEYAQGQGPKKIIDRTNEDGASILMNPAAKEHDLRIAQDNSGKKIFNFQVSQEVRKKARSIGPESAFELVRERIAQNKNPDEFSEEDKADLEYLAEELGLTIKQDDTMRIVFNNLALIVDAYNRKYKSNK